MVLELEWNKTSVTLPDSPNKTPINDISGLGQGRVTCVHRDSVALLSCTLVISTWNTNCVNLPTVEPSEATGGFIGCALRPVTFAAHSNSSVIFGTITGEPWHRNRVWSTCACHCDVGGRTRRWKEMNEKHNLEDLSNKALWVYLHMIMINLQVSHVSTVTSLLGRLLHLPVIEKTVTA